MKIVAQGGEPIEIQTEAGTLVIRISSASTSGRLVQPSARLSSQTRFSALAQTHESSSSASEIAAKRGRKKARRTFSPEAKARLAAAAKKRWAAAKRAGKSRL